MRSSVSARSPTLGSLAGVAEAVSSQYLSAAQHAPTARASATVTHFPPDGPSSCFPSSVNTNKAAISNYTQAFV